VRFREVLLLFKWRHTVSAVSLRSVLLKKRDSIAPDINTC
jgi:hypothetical protein